MSKSNHTGAQIKEVLRQVEDGRSAADVGRQFGVVYVWKAKYGGMDESEAQEVKQLQEENARLKRLVVDLSLDKTCCNRWFENTRWARSETGGSAGL